MIGIVANVRDVRLIVMDGDEMLIESVGECVMN